MNVRKLVFLPFLAVMPGLLSAQDVPETKRGISNNLAAALADTMPKFNPPPAEKPEPEPVAESPVGEPKNEIIRLPQVVVEGVRPPVFTEREVNTDKGLTELAVQRYFTNISGALNAVHMPFLTASKDELAVLLWQEDERLRRLSEFESQAAALESVGDKEGAKEVRQLMNGIFEQRPALPNSATFDPSVRSW